MESDDFRMRYELYIDDIKYIKTRLWTVTYYLLLLIAAIITFHHALRTEPNSSSGLLAYRNIELLLTPLACGVALVGTYFHYRFQKDLQGYRFRLIESILHLSESFQVYEIKNPIGYLSPCKDLSFTTIFNFLLWTGVSFVSVFVYKELTWITVTALVPAFLFPIICPLYILMRKTPEEKKQRAVVLVAALRIKEKAHCFNMK